MPLLRQAATRINPTPRPILPGQDAVVGGFESSSGRGRSDHPHLSSSLLLIALLLLSTLLPARSCYDYPFCSKLSHLTFSFFVFCCYRLLITPLSLSSYTLRYHSSRICIHILVDHIIIFAFSFLILIVRIDSHCIVILRCYFN